MSSNEAKSGRDSSDGWTHLNWSGTLNVCYRLLLVWSRASDAKWQVASEYVGGNQDEGSIRVGVVLVSGSTSRFSATHVLSRCLCRFRFPLYPPRNLPRDSFYTNSGNCVQCAKSSRNYMDVQGEP